MSLIDPSMNPMQILRRLPSGKTVEARHQWYRQMAHRSLESARLADSELQRLIATGEAYSDLDKGSEALFQWQQAITFTIVTSAFAAEAFINFIMDWELEKDMRDAWDRMPTPDKYMCVVRFVHNTTWLKGAAPLQNLCRLFSMRHKIVHPEAKLSKYTRSQPFSFDEFKAVAELYKLSDAEDAYDALDGALKEILYLEHPEWRP